MVAVPGDTGLRLRCRATSSEVVLNATAVLIWHACEGRRTLEEIGPGLRAEWPDYDWPDDEIEAVVEHLAGNGIVRKSEQAVESVPILRAGFLGVPPGFDPGDNYLVWALSHRAAVIAADPDASEIEVLFHCGPAESLSPTPATDDPDCIRIRIDPDGGARDPDADYIFDLSGQRLGRTENGYGLPPWIDAVDWWGGGADDAKLTLQALTQSRSEDGIDRDASWAALDANAGGSADIDPLRDALASRHGQPIALLSTTEDGGGVSAVNGEAIATSRFALISGSAADPHLAGKALLAALAGGVVPFYTGDPRLVAGINERAYVDPSIYDSVEQAAAVADMLCTDPDYRDRLLAPPVFYGNRLPSVLEPGKAGEALWQEILEEPHVVRKDHPAPSAAPAGRRLTIGMPTFDDYDGVYFSIQAVRLYHPEVLDDIEFLIVDNNPGGPCGEALRTLAQSIPEARYTTHGGVNGTAVSKNRVFLESESEIVLCMDSHVLIVPGALRKLLDYYDAHPGSRDLLQGPLLWDNMKSVATHFEPVWRNGMWGTWASDERGRDPDAEPFEIPMQGMGLFACRREAWPGFHPELRGFGSEEGYIHEKVRQAGGRSLCLPFLRWMHRFGRPMGPQYDLVWEDRIRNYFIGFRELGLDTSQMESHFAELLNPGVVDRTRRAVERELDSPFARFDAVYSIDLNGDRARWRRRVEPLAELGIDKRIRYQPAPADAGSNDAGCALALFEIVKDARLQGFRRIVVIDGDAVLRADAGWRLAEVEKRIADTEWHVVDLGAATTTPAADNAAGAPLALALHARSFEPLLDHLTGQGEADVSGQSGPPHLQHTLARLCWTETGTPGLATDPQLVVPGQYLV